MPMLPIAPDEWINSNEIIRILAEPGSHVVRLWRRSRTSSHGSEIIVFGDSARTIIAWLRGQPWGDEGGDIRPTQSHRRGR